MFSQKCHFKPTISFATKTNGLYFSFFEIVPFFYKIALKVHLETHCIISNDQNFGLVIKPDCNFFAFFKISNFKAFRYIMPIFVLKVPFTYSTKIECLFT